MGGGMSGEPLQGVSVHVGNRAASHVTPWVDREGGHRLITGLIGEPRGAPGDRLHPGIPTVVELPP